VPDGNNQAEVQHLKGVAIEWASQKTRAHLTRAEAEFSLRQVLIPKLTYTLQATTLSKQQCSLLYQQWGSIGTFRMQWLMARKVTKA